MDLQKDFAPILIVSLALALISGGVEGGRRGLVAGNGAAVFDVTKYGAKADGETESALAFQKAWTAACKSKGVPATVFVPKGDYMVGPVIFQGPCMGPMTVEVQGMLLANEDFSEYANGEWFMFRALDRLMLTGGGTFHGRGKSAWDMNDCGKKAKCENRLPPSIVFGQVNNSVMQQVNLIDSKGFQMKINDLNNFTVQDITITAPEKSPNTDGIHVSGSNNVTIKNSKIASGDDCVSIGEGSTNVVVSSVACGPGHGISIGSLGLRPDEKDVSGILVTNCTMVNTTNGARIKTWRQSPKLNASGIVFQDITMTNVSNPVIIDQNYGSKKRSGTSSVKVNDVHFKNLRGTTPSKSPVSLICSPSVPCEGVELVDIDLTPLGEATLQGFITKCENAKPTISGKFTLPKCLV